MDKHYRDLLIRALKGTLDTASRREFDRWVSDADNRRIYENALRIWDDVQRRTSAYNPDRDRLWEQLQSRIEVCGTPQRAERPAPKRRWMPILRTAAAVAAGVVVTLFAVRPDLSRTPVPARQEFCAFGGKSLAHLTDGSTVWLQSGSTLAYDSSFGAESRNVKLRGEGFFDIAKDPERPFTVEVEGLRIRVHGTKFNVNTSHEDRTVAVSLVEGSVALDSGNGETRRLHPGEIARYDPATQELDIRHGNVEQESCWAAGKLVFERQSLGEICRYLSRWYDIRIDISPALARNYAYTFTITDEPLEAILRIMSRINPIVYTFSDNRSVSISEVE